MSVVPFTLKVGGVIARYIRDPYTSVMGKSMHPQFEVCVPTEYLGVLCETEVHRYCIPQGYFLTTVHNGPYSGLEKAYQRLYRRAYWDKSMFVRNAPVMDEYINHLLNEGVTEQNLETRVYLPVERF